MTSSANHDRSVARPPHAEVLVWDEDPHRAERVRTAVAGCGGRPLTSPQPSRMYDLEDIPRGISVALVCLGAGAPGATALAMIQRLARKHVRVIGYGEHSDGWPLGARCRALLAGACAVLDSAAPAFLRELQMKLASLLSVEAAQRHE